MLKIGSTSCIYFFAQWPHLANFLQNGHFFASLIILIHFILALFTFQRAVQQFVKMGIKSPVIHWGYINSTDPPPRSEPGSYRYLQ